MCDAKNLYSYNDTLLVEIVYLLGNFEACIEYLWEVRVQRICDAVSLEEFFGEACRVREAFLFNFVLHPCHDVFFVHFCLLPLKVI